MTNKSKNLQETAFYSFFSAIFRDPVGVCVDDGSFKQPHLAPDSLIGLWGWMSCTPVAYWAISGHRMNQPSPHTLRERSPAWQHVAAPCSIIYYLRLPPPWVLVWRSPVKSTSIDIVTVRFPNFSLIRYPSTQLIVCCTSLHLKIVRSIVYHLILASFVAYKDGVNLAIVSAWHLVLWTSLLLRQWYIISPSDKF